MPRQKNNSRTKGSYAFIRGLVIKLVFLAVVISLAVLSVSMAIGYVLKNSDYFKIQEIAANEGNITDLSYLKGENIFALDLRKESRYILEHYPAYSNVKMVRILPNRVYAVFVKRKPLALVKLYRVFSVDQDMVLFEPPENTPDSQLPVITGLETKIFGPKMGKKYDVKELAFALNTLKAFRFIRGLRPYRVKRIEVANINNASVFVEVPNKQVAFVRSGTQEFSGWIELKLGENWFKDKLGILAMILSQTKNDLPNIKYIDLRFKDPLIKLKDNNAK